MPEAWFDDGSVDDLCTRIEDQLLILRDDYENDSYADEPELSSSFITRIRVAIEGFELRYKPQHTYSLSSQGERLARLAAKEYGLKGRS